MNFLASQEVLANLSQPATLLYEKMSEQGADALYNQQQIVSLTGQNMENSRLSLQELIDKKLLQVLKQNNEVVFKKVDASEASKKLSMNQDEQLVYSHIEQSAREGIWIKTIKAKTNLHQHIVLKCLKNLESQRYIKSVKSVKFPSRKIFMLYNLQPSIEVTGGPWYTDGELDDEFISHLLTIVWRFAAEKTFPDGFNNYSQVNMKTGKNEKIYTKNVVNYVTKQEILEFIKKINISKVDLTIPDIESLCEVLYFDNRLSKVGVNAYKVTLQSVLDLMSDNLVDNGKDTLGSDKTLEFTTLLEDSYDIYRSKNFIEPSLNDRETVYFDEWTL
ncbi:hypothetical protein ACO0SA_003083 [Hanseniaspora valbyensis]